jgi:hypothetical protein
MGFFDIFKKKEIKEENKDSENEISFQEIEEYLEKRQYETQSKDKETLTSIKYRLNSFLRELNEKLKILREVNLDSKKADDMTKSIVKTGLQSYLSFSEELINKLSHIEKEKTGDFLDEINNILFRFDKNSNSNYHRANILIGKELVAIREEINIFSKELMEIFNEDKKKITLPKEISKIKGMLTEFQDLERKNKQIESEIITITENINKEEESLKAIKIKIESTKNSEEYLKNINIKEKVLSQERKLEQEIIKLRSLIDFKYLTNIFHTNEKKMRIIKEYRDDFEINFLKDSGESLLDILSESKTDKNKIFDKINEIKELMNNLNENKSELKPNKVEEFLGEKESTESKINELVNEKEAKEKIYGSTNLEKEEIRKLIITALKEIGIKIK